VQVTCKQIKLDWKTRGRGLTTPICKTYYRGDDVDKEVLFWQEYEETEHSRVANQAVIAIDGTLRTLDCGRD